MNGKKTGQPPASKDALDMSGLDAAVSYEKMQQVQAEMAQVMHRMIDACLGLAEPRKPGKN